MSAMFLVLLTGAATAVAAGSAALFATRGVRRDVAALRADLAEARAERRAAVPAARTTPDAEAIRTAVADALADERERELAEARAFWAAQEAPLGYGTGEAGEALADPQLDAQLFGGQGAGPVPGAAGTDYEVLPYGPFLPRQADLAGLEPGGASPFRHPSDPDFGVPAPVVASQEQTAERLSELADLRMPLADVRPGPLGTLDVYVFADGTTLCMTPGDRDTADRLCDALDQGESPILLGGSAVAGGYALTFTYGEESVYVLADRVVASL
ncbi:MULTISPECIES: hypothetical protein [Streptomycetaceae]|uniref:hypothetical protein n=1 Tax=Streptomycetaceae TaxID=2062 RepID=UPI0003818105|nr:hypothetical protein [Streptomyces sp. BoleA5]MYX37330.1 hypothetical protein [Streptomyces sp. SID8377]